MHTTTKRLVAATASALAALTTSIAVAQTDAFAAPGDGARKILGPNFPDPGFAKFTTRAQGTKYYLYSTGGGFRVARSATPGANYTVVGNSMTTRPAWVRAADSGLWAPHVFQTSTTPGAERFTMYFSGNNTAGKHCIGAATSSSPTGPFAPAATPVICPPTGYKEAIDPAEYTSRYGNRYLVYKIGNYSPTRQFQIMAVRVNNGRGTTRTGDAPRVVLSKAQIGWAVAEAPDVYRDGNGRVHLFVSRNGYLDCNYATQVWSGDDLFALSNPRYVGGMGTSTSDRFCGPGGAEVIKDGSVLRIAFHTRASADPLRRPAWTGVLNRNGSAFTLG